MNARRLLVLAALLVGALGLPACSGSGGGGGGGDDDAEATWDQTDWDEADWG